MRTFVPPPGARCNEGAIDEFPPGRIVFQIRCRETADTPHVPPTQTWTRQGSGPAILDLPSRIQRIRIEGTYNGFGVNFVVWCGVSGDRGCLLVNEILGTASVASGTRYSGVHSALRSYGGRGQPCRELAIEYSVGVDWKILEVAAQMLVPPEPHTRSTPEAARHGWSILLVDHPCPTTGPGKESPPASAQLNSNTVRDIPWTSPGGRRNVRPRGDDDNALLIQSFEGEFRC